MTGAEVSPESAAPPAPRRLLALLAVPAFSFALAITIVTTYLPVLISEVSGPAVTGLLIGGEGLMALFVPVLVGGWSDTVRTRLGRRLPFVLAGGPLMAIALILMPLTTALIPLAGALLVFYVGYFTCYAPYRAMYPDLVPDEARGRSQGYQNAAREIGLGGALITGGVLLSIWQGLPFHVAAGILLVATGTFAWRVRERAVAAEEDQEPTETGSGFSGFARAWTLVRDQPRIRRLMIANALWEAALGALKTFVVLFVTVGLGRSASLASAALAVVAVAVVVAALVSGSLADRFGHAKLLTWAAAIYTLGLLVPVFVHSLFVLVAMFPLAFAAGVVMTLPYGLLMGLMPDEDHGAAAGTFEASRGIGVVAGPILAGIAVQLLRDPLSSTKGYAAAFLVAALAVGISVPLASRLDRD